MYTNNVLNTIVIYLMALQRTNCPNCGGRNTFTVTNNMGSLVWNCYKLLVMSKVVLVYLIH